MKRCSEQNQSEFETWMPGSNQHEKPGLHAVTLPMLIALPMNKTPGTWRTKLTRMCLRVLMPSLFSDFGADTAIGLIAVRLTEAQEHEAGSVYRLDRKKSDFLVLELLYPARKRQG
jgi:hypothetical protein